MSTDLLPSKEKIKREKVKPQKWRGQVSIPCVEFSGIGGEEDAAAFLNF